MLVLSPCVDETKKQVANTVQVLSSAPPTNEISPQARGQVNTQARGQVKNLYQCTSRLLYKHYHAVAGDDPIGKVQPHTQQRLEAKQTACRAPRYPSTLPVEHSTENTHNDVE